MNVSRGIAGVERQCGLDVSDEDALIELKFGLTEVVYEWAKGEVIPPYMVFLGDSFCLRQWGSKAVIFSHMCLSVSRVTQKGTYGFGQNVLK